jgi:NDP-sugar pyrophosphorylase family protein
MIAIIIAPGINPGLEFLNKHYPSPMLPLVDRPFIQHVIEFLIEQGITHFEFILSHLPEQLEALLGDGSRWGAHFSFHLAQDPQMPYEMIKTFDLNENEPCLLAHADRLPHMDLNAAVLALNENLYESTFWMDAHEKEGAENTWTGWAYLPNKCLKELPSGLDEKGLRDHLLTMPSKHSFQETVNTCLSVQSHQKFWNLTRRF